MRRKRIGFLIIAVVVVLALGGGAIFVLSHRGSVPATATVVPASGAPRPALATVRQLTSGTPAAQRRAVTPQLLSLLPSGPLFPAGTTFSPAPQSWHRSGAYANISGTLKKPGHHAVSVEIGLVLRNGRWLVTFEEQR